jgi:hypothetical protein
MNKTLDEGVIKFSYTLKRTTAPLPLEYLELEKWRVILYRMGLIGEYKDEKVGFGNLSRVIDQNNQEFIITGTQTGRFPNLAAQHYCKVIFCDLKKMKVRAEGLIAPSSESLTHFAIYQVSPKIKYVFHVHHHELWVRMLSEGHDHTPDNVSYGTEKMALAAKECIKDKTSGIFAMAGHEDGIIAYGTTAEEAGKEILEMYKILKN